MGDELVPMGELGLTQPSENIFDQIAKSSQFLGRVMLMGSNSSLVQEGKMPLGHYAFIPSQNIFQDLSNEVDVLVCAWRPKAMDVSGDEIISSFKVDSPIFKEIVEKSGVKDSGCMYGPEFLLYIKSIKSFATYFMSSKTSRREAPNLKSLMGKAATLKSRFIVPPKSRYKWHGPVVVPCSTPFEIPSIDVLKEEISKFSTPKEEEREPADEAVTERET